jgi:hypothetical protein
MKIFEGKTTAERNKMIAAAVLGVTALIALYLTLGRSLFGSSTTTAKVTVSATPRPAGPATNGPGGKFKLPTAEEQSLNEVVPVVYNPNWAGAPDPGRNIFAFYEPPEPCPPTVCIPTPTPIVTPKPPTPTPTPIFEARSLNVQSVYAGSRAFRLEVNGDRFTPDARIYFNQNEVPTMFVSPQKLAANIPQNFISQEGSRQVIVQTPDGTAYSDALSLTVQAPPKPTLNYIGMIARTRGNNDTAYFIDASRPITPANQPPPFGARLNDVVAGRFRLVDIGPAQVIFEDTQLGFKHRVPIAKATAGTSGPAGQPNRGGFPQGFPVDTSRGVPGFPGMPVTVQPANPQPRPSRSPAEKKDDVDDDGDGDGDGDGGR